MMLLICLLRRFGREIPSYRGVGVAVPMSCFITKVQLSFARSAVDHSQREVVYIVDGLPWNESHRSVYRLFVQHLTPTS